MGIERLIICKHLYRLTDYSLENDRSIGFPHSSFSPRSAVTRPFVPLQSVLTISNGLQFLSLCVFCRSFGLTSFNVRELTSLNHPSEHI
jgi:hypothetical protein